MQFPGREVQHDVEQPRPLRLNLVAETMLPRVTANDKGAVRFRTPVTDADDAPSRRKAITFTNPCPFPVAFSLDTRGPFAVAGTVSAVLASTLEPGATGTTRGLPIAGTTERV